MKENNFYITTTLPYVNSDPHIGFALEIVQADTIARYKRLMETKVFFSTGTDEHGQKIFEAAQKQKEEVHEYVDKYAKEFGKLKEALNISNDAFIRTTDKDHGRATQEIWKKCALAGDIYKKSYEGKYCVGCEAFKTEKDLDENDCCFIHPNLEIKILTEENYFFRFSKYQDKLLKYLSQTGVILPDWRREEAIAFVKGGLEDFSISREKERLSWGIPVPGDDTQVMYVWFDALTNYISTLGWPEDKEGKFKEFWQNGEVIQMAGKDQVRFQSLMWQAMLMSANVKNTDKIVYHGFINSGGQKMSKSLGNVINPLDVVKEYSTDAVRYFLLRHVQSFEDSDVTAEKIKEAYNANLANGLGNLTSRVMKMAISYDVDFNNLPNKVGDMPKIISRHLDSFEYSKALDEIWLFLSSLDEFIQKEEPFKKIKTDKEGAHNDIREVLGGLFGIALNLEPFLPETSKKIKQLIIEKKLPEAPLFLRKD